MAKVQIQSKSHYDAAEVNQTLRWPHRFRCQRFLEEVNYTDFRMRQDHLLCTQT
jgi:hypothetical protein